VDRTRVAGWWLPKAKLDLAKRLARAIRAGVATPPEDIRTDVNGRTFLATKTVIIGRRMNADLRRLGF